MTVSQPTDSFQFHFRHQFTPRFLTTITTTNTLVVITCGNVPINLPFLKQTTKRTTKRQKYIINTTQYNGNMRSKKTTRHIHYLTKQKHYNQ